MFAGIYPRHRWVALALTALLAAVFIAEAKTVSLETKRPPSNGKESLIWNVNREIKGFKVEVVEGRCIINTVRFLGGQEFRVGAWLEKKQNLTKKLDANVRVGQLRVNVDKGGGAQIRLILETD